MSALCEIDVNCISHVKKGVKRQRCGVSPLPPKAKQNLDPLIIHNKWSDEEKQFLITTVKDIGEENWSSCEAIINATFGRNRTSKSCQSCYNRIKASTATPNVSNATWSDAAVQTDISLSPWDNFTFLKHMEGPELNSTSKESQLTTDLHSSSDSSILRSLLLEERFKPTGTSTPLKEKDRSSDDHSYGSSVFQPADSSNHTFDHAYTQKEVKLTIKKKHISAPTNRLKKHTISVQRLGNNSIHPTGYLISSKESLSLKLLLERTRKISAIGKKIMSIPSLKKCVLDVMYESVGERPDVMRNKKHGFVSVLMKKDFESLKNFNFEDVVGELQEKFPELLHLLQSMMLSQKNKTSDIEKAAIIPKLALIYSVIMQTRHHEFSRFQRVIAMCLADNICDQAVYDRLNRLGVASPYCVTLKVFNEIGKMYPKLIKESLQEGKYVRFVGDNLNFSIGTNHETMNNHKHMVHMFVSTALISDHHFMSKPEPPEIPFEELTTDNILLSAHEYTIIKRDITKLLVDMTCSKLPQLKYCLESVPKNLLGTESNHLGKKTKIVPLPCLPYNEQKYQNDVKILGWYQQLSEQIIAESGVDPNTKFQIGGDQLTRERLTGAMLMRLGNRIPSERFHNIGRCTFEFFHLGMNYLEKAIFAELWNEKGVVEVGTLRGECERLNRTTVDPNIMKAYDADKRFFLEYLSAVAIEAVMDHFGMEHVNDTPTKNVPPTFENIEKQKEWVFKQFGNVVDHYIYPAWLGRSQQQPSSDDDDIGMQDFLEVCLTNGQMLRIPMGRPSTPQSKPDKIKEYAHFSLEVGFTFKFFLELVKCPDRERFLALLKIMMIHLKAHSINAKYPREIMRMLIQQYSVFGLREACQIFSSCFVNLHGKTDSHVPADLIQEWNVKESKLHIKHMFSNKGPENIISRTSALPGIHEIATKFDNEAGTIIRAKRHTAKKIDEKDEQRLMGDMRSIKPFLHVDGRAYDAFNKIKKSLVLKVEGYNVKKWIEKNKRSFFI